MGITSSRGRRATALAALLCVAPFAAACSGGPSGGGASESAEPSGDIRVVANWTGAEGEAFQSVVDGFEAKYPGTNVKVEVVPFDQTQTQLAQQFAAGNAPDAAVALPSTVRQFSQQGLLMDLDEQWNSWIEAGEYNDSLKAIATGAEGKANAVYFKGNVNGLIWSTEKTDAKLGVKESPASWDEFTAVLDKANASGKAFAVGAKDVWVPTQWVDPVLLNVAGLEKFQQLQRGEIGWDDPKVVEAMTVLSGLIEKYWSADALDTGFTDEVCGWVSGKHAFGNNGAFVSSVVPSCDKSLKAGKDYSFFPFPAYDGVEPAQAVSGDLFIGNAQSKNPATTKAFLAYLGSVEGQSVWAKKGGFIAPNMKVPADVYPSESDRAAAALWPKDASGAAGYDLDDWIGGEIQAKYRQALDNLIRTHDVEKFTQAMVAADTRSKD
ncbi:ABC transporter substrate-binding protein [Sinomonas halotolerans]|uniref:Extracellular solute-binding protein n=1 Tax=Sinomonas halotolerans TaxID=1644133 RepID=A0ABU9WXQ0_9MICC